MNAPGSEGAAAAAPGQVVRRGVFWGAFAFLPAAALVAAVAAAVIAPHVFAETLAAVEADPVVALVLYTVLGAGHWAAFTVHALRNARLAPSQRARWVLAFVFATSVAAPLYWWKGLAAPAA